MRPGLTRTSRFFRSVWAGENLIRLLVRRARQCIIQTRGYSESAARQDSDNSRHLPACTQNAQHSIGKLRRCINSRQIEIVPAVQIAISLIGATALGNLEAVVLHD